MSTGVRVQVLGPVRASADGTPIELRGQTARTVLARLSLSAGAVVSIDQLAEALWGEDPPAEPVVSLRSIISRLRTRLGRDTIRTIGGGYRLDPDLVQVDLEEVERAARRLGQADVDPDDLRTCIELWDGEPLSDVAWTSSFEPERVRIDELRARLTDGYHDAMIRRGRAAEAVPDLERAARARPTRESTQLLLMLALDACGRTADALRAGDEYRHRLIDETGVNPSEAYDRVVHSLLAADESAEETQTTGAPAARVLVHGRSRWIPPDTPFVGRDDERSALGRALDRRRLITIIGPGGVGKTRLVTEFTSVMEEDAVDMVSLASVHRQASVETAVAATLGLETSPTETRAALVNRLGGSRILVLDNCEHVLASARSFVASVLRSVEDLTVMTTSRIRLGLPEEHLIAVGPLDLTADGPEHSPPVSLFLDRVERSGAAAARLDDRDLRVVADICRLLDGLPLALELAAARVPMLGIDGLRERLLEGLGIPGTRIADDDRRQATIESTVEWSLSLLSPAARQLFNEMSVFPSWFDLSVLERVATGTDVADGLVEVVDSSLVVIDAERPRYRLLQPVREVARRQLGEDETASVTDRYLAWTTAMVERVDRAWQDDQRADAHRMIASHRRDIGNAMSLLARREDAETHGRCAHVLTRALAHRADNELIDLCNVEVGPSVEGELARCTLAWHQGDPARAVAIGEHLLDSIEEDSVHGPFAHWALACAYLYLGDADAVAQNARAAASEARESDSMRSECVALWALARLYQGRADEATKVLADHADLLGASTSGGFVTYARAEIASSTDAEASARLFAMAAQEAAESSSTFNLRIAEVSQLALLVRLGRTKEAAAVALRVVPDLLRSGTLPQAWTALRHVADLLGHHGEPALALTILDSAEADESAPAVVGEAVDIEAGLRKTFARSVAGSGANRRLMPINGLWEVVEPVLAGRVREGDAGRE